MTIPPQARDGLDGRAAKTRKTADPAVRIPTAAAASDCIAAVCDDTPAFRSNFLGVFGPSFVRPSRSPCWYRSPMPGAFERKPYHKSRRRSSLRVRGQTRKSRLDTVRCYPRVGRHATISLASSIAVELRGSLRAALSNSAAVGSSTLGSLPSFPSTSDCPEPSAPMAT
jgi:hypothetical protein